MSRYSRLVASAFVIGLSFVGSARADVVNGGFEGGSSGWSHFGGGIVNNLTLQDGVSKLHASEGNLFAYSETGSGMPVGFLAQLAIPTDGAGSVLSFDFDFFTDEPVVGGANDQFTLTVTPQIGAAITYTIANVASMGEGLLGGPRTNANISGYDRHTGWLTQSIVLPAAFAGQSVSFFFQILDNNFTAPSGFALDDVRLEAVPEPSTTVLLLGTLACVAGWKLRRRKAVAEPVVA